ncbi:hypothetical protein [Mesoplasma corruscae]|uniref:Uncharacterized protein n=1 Tax=Mesoplasma corruscae TaxID=216874 RepID=A0A2S5RHX9_9MOLU|nr:hypothetical protein [Mesoplasma corruscae]PPE06765.1 hypothetical protein MCORR_v1c03960 [Mesoplasma corruscae]
MNRSSAVPRGLLKFYQYLGTFFSALILAVTIVLISKYASSMNPLLYGGIIGIEVYMLWKSIYSAVVIIKYMNNATDEEIIANRFIMAVLSMGVGGFITPFVLTQLPKIETNSTINPRVFLAKHLGWTMFIGSILALGATFLFALTSPMKGLFVIDTTTMIVIGIYVVIFLIGLLGISFFSSKTASEKISQKNFLGFTMQVIGVIYTLIATIEMILIAVMGVIRLIAVISDAIRYAANSEGIWMVFAIFIAFARITFEMMYVSMIFQISGSIIKGIWAKDQVITIKNFQNIDEKEAELNTKR